MHHCQVRTREGNKGAGALTGFKVTLDSQSLCPRRGFKLSDYGVETRPVFYPMHVLPPYREAAQEDGPFPVAERISQTGLSLPTWAGLQREDVDYVCGALRECIRESALA